MKKILLISLALTGLCANAQSFEHRYGTSESESVTDAAFTQSGGDDGYFMVGTSANNGAGNPGRELVVARTDIDGRLTCTFCFENHISLAIDSKMPLFLHERNAHDDFYTMLSSASNKLNKFVVHCFTGDKNTLKKYLDLGSYIGITGWITDKDRGSHLHAIMQYIPSDRLMIEINRDDNGNLSQDTISGLFEYNQENGTKNPMYVFTKIEEWENLS